MKLMAPEGETKDLPEWLLWAVAIIGTIVLTVTVLDDGWIKLIVNGPFP